MSDVVTAWLGFLFGLTGIGALTSIVVKIARSWQGGLR